MFTVSKVSPEYELLCSRILFLLTYDTTFNFETLFEKESLADHIHEVRPISHHRPMLLLHLTH